jgi:hypothetical protein
MGCQAHRRCLLERTADRIHFVDAKPSVKHNVFTAMDPKLYLRSRESPRHRVDGKQYIAVQSGWGVDAQKMASRLEQSGRTRTCVPQGGVIWVFALED